MSFQSSLDSFLSPVANPQALPIVIAALLLVCIILLILSFAQNRRINKLLRGKNTMTIEDSIIELAKELDVLTSFQQDTETYLELVEKRLRKSNQALETRRFNPFKGTGAGGNQSFACAFLNENGDGLILSSLYASDRMSVFAKPIQKFVPAFELTEEETAALESSKDSLQR